MILYLRDVQRVLACVPTTRVRSYPAGWSRSPHAGLGGLDVPLEQGGVRIGSRTNWQGELDVRQQIISTQGDAACTFAASPG